jgi:hypothetical protein
MPETTAINATRANNARTQFAKNRLRGARGSKISSDILFVLVPHLPQETICTGQAIESVSWE